MTSGTFNSHLEGVYSREKMMKYEPGSTYRFSATVLRFFSVKYVTGYLVAVLCLHCFRVESVFCLGS